MINGLKQVSNYMPETIERGYVHFIDQRTWSNELSRRVQHFGYKYNYKSKRIEPWMKLGKMPNWLISLCNRLHVDGHMPQPADQVIINEYESGQGIGDHIDCEPCFGDTVASLSLLSPIVMQFKKGHNTIEPILLMPRSLLIISGEARHDWTHGIKKCTQETFGGSIYKRQRRISITFRTVKLEE